MKFSPTQTENTAPLFVIAWSSSWGIPNSPGHSTLLYFEDLNKLDCQKIQMTE